MKKNNPFVKSNYKRRKNDHYPTIDTRCVDALLDSNLSLFNYVWDCCSINGSGILDRLRHHKKIVYQGKDAFTLNPSKGKRIEWIISNPPYERSKVIKIIEFQVARLNIGQISGVAMLLRTGFDHAKAYQKLFRDCPYYAGQIKLTFRPVWIKGKPIASPIHNYVWHIWQKTAQGLPFVIYSK